MHPFTPRKIKMKIQLFKKFILDQAIKHLTTKAGFTHPGNLESSGMIIQKFKEACMQLDAGIIEPYIEEDSFFQDKEKYLFLADLKMLFDRYKKHGASPVTVKVSEGSCKGCSFGKPVSIFTLSGVSGKTVFPRFGFVIDLENGILKDMYQCNMII